jgi:hypothetical protein
MDSIRDFRNYIEGLTRGLGIFHWPRVPTYFHTLRLLQSRHSNAHLKAFMTREMYRSYHHLRIAQDLVRWLAFKVSELCPPDGSRETTSARRHAHPTVEALLHFERVSVLYELIKFAEKRYMNIDIRDDTHLIEFSSVAGPSGPRLQSRIARHAEEYSRELDEQASKGISIQQEPEARSLRESLAQSVIRQADFQFAYNRHQTVVIRMAAILEHQMPPALLPDSLSVGPYTLGQYRNLWRYLIALVSVHDFCLVQAMRLIGHVPYNDAVLTVTDDQVVAAMNEGWSIPSDATREMLRDITYDPSIEWMDVAYQPLISVDRGELLVTPFLILGSSFERNLLAVLHRLERRKEGNERLKAAREQLMIHTLEPLLRSASLPCKPRVKVAEGRRTVGDIDMLVWNQAGTSVLCLSLKWFYGPDSAQEVLNHDDWFAAAQRQLKRMMAVIQADPMRFAKDRGIEPVFSRSATVVGTVCDQTCLPSEMIPDESIAFVTMSQLMGAIHVGGSNLDAVYSALYREWYAAPPPDAYEPVIQEMRIGEYVVRIPSLARREY